MCLNLCTKIAFLVVFVFFKKYYDIKFLHLKRRKRGFYCDTIYSCTSIIFILHLLNEINVSAEGPLCIKAVVNMEDKCPLNLNQFHL